MAAPTITRGAPAAAPSRHHAFTGTWALVRFILRRDRVRIAVWVAATAFLMLLMTASFPDLYPEAADRQARATLMSSPAGIAFSGPGHGLDDYTFGAMLAHEMLGFLAIIVALMSIFMVTRHTRAEEEAGRTELLRAGVLGRHSDTMAALLVVVGMNLTIAVLLALGLPRTGADLTAGSSLLFALAVASVGVVFAGIAAICAQVTEHSRGANGIGGIALGLAFTLRAAGDVRDGTLSWLSPIGWTQATRVYVDDRWWPLGLAVGLFAVVAVAALVVSDKRDVGAGLVPPRPGHRHASTALVHPFGLALRLQRGTLIGWATGLFAFGLMYGSFLEQVEEFAATNEFVQEWLVAAGGATFTDAFAAQLAVMMAMLASGFAIQSALRPRGEEIGGRAEPLLATGLDRARWTGSHLAVSIGGSAVILVLAGLGLGITSAIASGDAAWLGRMVGATAVHIPAVWVLAGLAVALFGTAPRWTGLAWAVLAYGVVAWFFGVMLRLPGWLMRAAPFDHTPQVPAADLAVLPLALMSAVALALAGVGLIGIRQRDFGAV